MLVIIRADASREIGSGHIMRCLTLAEKLKSNGAEVSFICRDFDGNLAEYIRNKGFTVQLLPPLKEEVNNYDFNNSERKWLGVDWETDLEETMEFLVNLRKQIDWMIIDHYGIDYKWEARIRTVVPNIMVIDDLANRNHICQILLDQNFFNYPTLRYSLLVPKNCRMLLGPHYALLRPEFNRSRLNSQSHDGEIKQIFVFFGGSDSTNETLKTLLALENLPVNIDVVVGGINPHIKIIEEYTSTRDNIKLYYNVNKMAELMIRADLAIGASGSTSWERCCLGLPTIIISVADNQVNIARNLQMSHCAKYLGRSTEVTKEDILSSVHFFMRNPKELIRFSENSRKLVDGYGLDRVSNIIYPNDSQGVL